MIAYGLGDLVGGAGAASISAFTVRGMDKLVEVFELSERFKRLRDPSARHHLGARVDGRNQEGGQPWPGGSSRTAKPRS